MRMETLGVSVMSGSPPRGPPPARLRSPQVPVDQLECISAGLSQPGLSQAGLGNELRPGACERRLSWVARNHLALEKRAMKLGQKDIAEMVRRGPRTSPHERARVLV